MKFTQTEIPDVVLVEPQVFSDSRGFFMETYHEAKFAEAGIPERFVQDNHAKSIKSVLRGLHYQIKYSQGKLVRVTEGEVLDVAVDLRKSSPTFGKWTSAVLTAENKHQLYIPPGFAHGYCVLSESAEVVYKCTELYSPGDDAGILWNDPDIGIAWPVKHPIISEKDRNQPRFQDAQVFE